MNEGNSNGNGLVEDNEAVSKNEATDVTNTIEKNKTAKKKKNLLLTVIFSMIALLILAGFVLWGIANISGKSNLYNKASSEGPILEGIQSEETSNVESEKDITWKKGWIRYNDEIYQYNEDILTFLVMGIDKTSEVKVLESGVDGGQADLIMLAVFNPHTKTTSLITINRNTMTTIDVYDENGDYVGSGEGQICLQHGYGDGATLSCERMEKAVSNLFYNLPIHGYISINMGAIKAINSAVDGVTMTLDEDFKASLDGVSVSIPKGEHTFTDDEAHVYIRYRDHAEFDSATTRLNREKKYMAAFLSKLKEETAKDITVPLKVYNELSPYIVTDINTSEMTYMVSNTHNYKFDFNNIYSLEGTTVIGKTEHEEFNYDPDHLYDMIIKIFYEKVY
ncbi:LCP family protein [Butyrivibrio proteoclasticus]|nr:LCP family protein [Butyrivibrio proteoclasticus]